jgi:hypothetical protein
MRPPGTTSPEIPGASTSQLNWSPLVKSTARSQIYEDGALGIVGVRQANPA